MKYEHRQRLDQPQGELTMQFREAFSRSQSGDQAGLTAMQGFATIGAKEAEAVIIEEINKARLGSPQATFKQCLDSVVAANPLLHSHLPIMELFSEAGAT